MDKVLRYAILFQYLWKKLIKRQADKSLIIIKIEAIGDYLLFRNFLKTIRESRKYSGYKITLVGNILWKELAIKYDSKYLDEFIWIKPLELNEIKKAKKIYDEISSKRYNELITFHYSRSLATEILSLVVIANEKTTMSGDVLNLKPAIKKFTDKVYSKIISVPNTCRHEFQRNLYFTSEVTGEIIELNKPELDTTDSPSQTELNTANKYFVVAPGAGVKNRQISKPTLQKIIHFLLTNKIPLVFVGALNEAEYVESVVVPFKSELIINLTGKTTLVELSSIVHKAEAVLCNDSSIYHLAVALNKKTLCFAGGGHFKRFVEYPGVKDVYLAYYNMACFNCDWKCIFKFNIDQPYPCIDNLDATNIEEIITKHLLFK